MVLPCRDTVPRRTTAGLDTVAVRCPRTAVTREIIRLAGVPVAAPSANLSGKPSTTTAEHVLHDLDGKIEAVVDDGPCQVGVESTIVDMTGPVPRLLRPGGLGAGIAEAVLGRLEVDPAVTAPVAADAVVRAPGMKYRHYAPQGQVLIVPGSREKAAAYIRRHFAPGDAVLCFQEELPLYDGCNPTAYGREDDAETLARGLFAALRELDRADISTIFARCPRRRRRGLRRAQPAAEGRRLPHRAGGRAVKVLGITGGTGCGKTTLLRRVAARGGAVIDCDAVYHRLLETDAALLAAIGGRFPGVVSGGALDRKQLGRQVFADPAAPGRPEPAGAPVRLRGGGPGAGRGPAGRPPLAAVDAVALVESGLGRLCDETVAVTAPEAARVARLMAREGISEEYARLRISARSPTRPSRPSAAARFTTTTPAPTPSLRRATAAGRADRRNSHGRTELEGSPPDAAGRAEARLRPAQRGRPGRHAGLLRRLRALHRRGQDGARGPWTPPWLRPGPPASRSWTRRGP